MDPRRSQSRAEHSARAKCAYSSMPHHLSGPRCWSNIPLLAARVGPDSGMNGFCVVHTTHNLLVDTVPAQNDTDDTTSASLIATAQPRQRAAHP